MNKKANADSGRKDEYVVMKSESYKFAEALREQLLQFAGTLQRKGALRCGGFKALQFQFNTIV